MISKLFFIMIGIIICSTMVSKDADVLEKG